MINSLEQSSPAKRRLYKRCAVKPIPEAIPDERGWMLAPTDEKHRAFQAFKVHAFFPGLPRPIYRSFRDEESALAFIAEQKARAIAHDPKREEPLLTSRDLAARLHVTMATLKELRRRAAIPFIRLTRHLHLYRWSEVCAAMEEDRQPVTLPGKVFKVEPCEKQGYRFRVRGEENGKRIERYLKSAAEAEAFARERNNAVGNKAIAPLPRYVKGLTPDDPPYRVRPYHADDRPDLPFEVIAYFEGEKAARTKRCRTEREAYTYANRRNFEELKRQLEIGEIKADAPSEVAPAPPVAEPSAPVHFWTPEELTRAASKTMRGKPFNVRPSKQGGFSFVVNRRGDTGRTRKFFYTKAEADQYAHMRNLECETQGTDSLVFPAWLRVLAQRCQHLLEPHGRNIDDATRHYLEYLERTKRSCSVTDLAARCLESKKGSGVSAYYLNDFKKRMLHFATYVGPKTVVLEITVRMVDDYLLSFTTLSGSSRNSYRRMLGTLFNYGMATANLTENPAKRSAKAKVRQSPVGILTPDQLAAILKVAPPEILPAIAIGAFAGLRTAELQRLDWAQVDLEDGCIEVLAENAKSSSRRIVTMQPNLASWLRPHARKAGPVWPYNGLIPSFHFAALITAAELPGWPRNALRHSYASYHYAHFNNAQMLAYEMGHTTTSLIFQHYRQVVRKAQGARYWDIRPAADYDKVVKFEAETAQS